MFVDFTAAWCVTCQYNKRSTLADAEVLADFDSPQGRAAARRLDPARPGHHRGADRAGTQRRAGLQCLQAPGKPPVVLTEILGKDEVREALAAL